MALTGKYFREHFPCGKTKVSRRVRTKIRYTYSFSKVNLKFFFFTQWCDSSLDVVIMYGGPFSSPHRCSAEFPKGARPRFEPRTLRKAGVLCLPVSCATPQKSYATPQVSYATPQVSYATPQVSYPLVCHSPSELCHSLSELRHTPSYLCNTPCEA